METEYIYKNRSVSSCLLAAYQLFNENFKAIVRTTWLPVLLNALCGALFVILNIRQAKLEQFAENHTGLYITLFILSIIAGIVCTVWAWARVMSLLNGWSRKKNTWRLLILFLCNIVIISIIGAAICVPCVLLIQRMEVTPQVFFTDNWLIFLFLAFIILLILLPLVYSTMRYLFKTEANYLTDLPKTYAVGFRYLGFIFITMLLLGIISGIIGLVIGLPQAILSMAQTVSAMGVMMGDPDGMPGYFLTLHGSTTTLTAILMFYLSVFELLVAMFMYGSIEKKRDERRHSLIRDVELSEENISNEKKPNDNRHDIAYSHPGR